MPEYEIFAVPAPDFHLIEPDLRAQFGDGTFVVLAEMPESGERREWNPDFPQENGTWLHFGAQQITVFTGKAEVGQDIRTSLAQIVAEELRVAPETLHLVMADTGLTPFDMGTFGSRTTPFSGPHCRHVAAAAREWLLDLAAQRANVERASLSIDAGRVHHAATNRCFSFGELAQNQKTAKRLDANAEITSPQDWKVVGQPISKVSARDMATGAHQYTSDLSLPGLMWGKILRPPAFKATLQSLDDTAARALPGVLVVREEEFVGVVAPTADLAQRALASLQATWNEPIHPSNREVFDGFLVRDSSDDTQGARNSEPFVQGDVSTGLAASDCVVEANYRIAYLAHAPLEPRAALAEWNGEGESATLTVWTGTQRPFGVRDELAAALEIPAA
ncbi:MAG TPA: molybdopterin cofactor-binding domain-containing protein, partial [Abditibacterium sp.]